MKRFLCAIAVVLFGVLPAHAASSFTEGVKVDANGVVLPLTSSGNSQKAVIFPYGVAPNASNIGVQNEAYISLCPTDKEPPCTANLCGNGTKDAPYNANGSSDSQKADRLDAILAHCQPNYDIHFVPNPSADYVTRGWRFGVRRTVGNGCRIYAKGATIRLYGAANGTADGFVFGTDNTVRTDGFEIHGGKVNADAVNQPKWTSGSARFVGMFQLQGSNNIIDNVEMVGGGSASAGIENFWCNLTASGISGVSENNIIENCYAHAPATGNLGAITVLATGAVPGSGRTSKNNKIINNVIDMTGNDSPVATGLAGGADLYEGNTVTGCYNGFYSEPLFAQPNLETIRNNTFTANMAGMSVISAAGTPAVAGYVIDGNLFMDDTGAISIYADDGLGVPGGTALRFDSVIIRNNKVLHTGGLDHGHIKFNLLSITSATAEGNTVDSDYAYAINVAATNENVSNNKQLSGGLTPYSKIYAIGAQQMVRTEDVLTTDVHTKNLNTSNIMAGGTIQGNGSLLTNLQASAIEGMGRLVGDVNTDITTGDYAVIGDTTFTAGRTWAMPSASDNAGKWKLILATAGATEYPLTVSGVNVGPNQIALSGGSLPVFSDGRQWYSWPNDPRKYYRATLTQSSTSAPTATVMENSLGAAIVWARSSSGVYTGTLTGAFTASKTFLPAPTIFDLGSGVMVSVSLVRTSANVITLTTTRSTDALAYSVNDGLITDYPVQVIVGP